MELLNSSEIQPQIAIVGAGVAGLATGIALHQRGFKNVVIYERDAVFSDRRQGYGLTLMQGLSALRRLNLYERVRQELDAPALAHYTFHGPSGCLLGAFGTVLWSDDSSNPSSVISNKRNLHVSRQALRRLLLEEYTRLFPGSFSLKWNSRLLSLDAKNLAPPFTLHFADGSKSIADILIGADGINSAIRRLSYNSSPLEYLGVVVVLGISFVKSGCFGSDDTIFESVDGKFRFYVMPHREPKNFDSEGSSKSYMWQLSFLVPDESKAIEFGKISGHDSLLKFVMDHLGEWHPPIPQLISNTPLSLLLAMPIYDRGVYTCLPDVIKEGLWLIGDAAHPMSPFKGQGANQALIDGVEIADLLAKHYLRVNADQSNLDFADGYSSQSHSSRNSLSLQEEMNIFYEKMLDRVAPKILKSRERIKHYHSESEVLAVESYCYGDYVTPSFVAHLNTLSLNGTFFLNRDKPLYEAIKKELQLWIKKSGFSS